jgi:hypothetical protein
VRTHLHRGEVELIIDLENQFTIWCVKKTSVIF